LRGQTRANWKAPKKLEKQADIAAEIFIVCLESMTESLGRWEDNNANTPRPLND
jgi:hypothetical protein